MVELPSRRDVVPEVASAADAGFTKALDESIAGGVKTCFVRFLHRRRHAARNHHDLDVRDSNEGKKDVRNRGKKKRDKNMKRGIIELKTACYIDGIVGEKEKET